MRNKRKGGFDSGKNDFMDSVGPGLGDSTCLGSESDMPPTKQEMFVGSTQNTFRQKLVQMKIPRANYESMTKKSK